MLQLQEEWKKIGPVSRKQSEALWTRFRKACDDFFAAKADFYKDITQNVAENLAKKEALIQKVKDYQFVENHDANFEALKGFQREWMSIGFVPMRHKDSLQDEYRKSIDALFEKMKITQNEISTAEYRNMVENMKDNPDSRDKVRRERNILTNKITKLREEITVLENNIGFFSNSKQSELMRAEYEKKINRAKNDVKVLETKLKILNEQ